MSNVEPRPVLPTKSVSPAKPLASELASFSKTSAGAVEVSATADDSLNRSAQTRGASIRNDETGPLPDDSPSNTSVSTLVEHQLPGPKATAESKAAESASGRWRISLREYMGLVTIVILSIGLVFSIQRLRSSQIEVTQLREETGYLQKMEPGQVAAARAPSDQPLTYRVRVRVPAGPTKFRVAYSSVWPRDEAAPQWYGAVPLPEGESVVTIRILEDPRDKRWKIASLVSSLEGNQRMATVLPPPHVTIFRGSHDVLSTGVGRETQAVQPTDSIRILDERWLVGEGGLLLYGDRAPRTDQVGIYAELQPDVGPL